MRLLSIILKKKQITVLKVLWVRSTGCLNLLINDLLQMKCDWKYISSYSSIRLCWITRNENSFIKIPLFLWQFFGAEFLTKINDFLMCCTYRIHCSAVWLMILDSWWSLVFQAAEVEHFQYIFKKKFFQFVHTDLPSRAKAWTVVLILLTKFFSFRRMEAMEMMPVLLLLLHL